MKQKGQGFGKPPPLAQPIQQIGHVLQKAKLREGQRVKVKTGPFEGVEGTVIRVKRSRRVMVEIPGMLAIATTFVKPEELEIL